MTIENVAVVNWFTKKRETIDKSGGEILEEIRTEIGQRSARIREQDMAGFADVVWEVVKESSDLRELCADSRLPVCSLFHHLKNTAGVVVALAYHQGYDRGKLQMTRAAALLHDMGKLVALGKGKKHVEKTDAFLKALLENVQALDRNQKHHLKRISTKHHSASWYGEYQASADDERLLSLADSIASATDRAYEVNISGLTLTKDEFTAGKRCKVKISSTDSLFPHILRFDDRCDFSCKKQEIVLGRRESIEVSLIPSKTKAPNQVMPFFDEVINGGPIVSLGPHHALKGRLRLFAMDIQGIQSFVGGSKKLPALRGGSFLIEDVLKDAEEIVANYLSPEVVLFRGGGNLIAFLPPDEELAERLKDEIQEAIAKKTGGGLRAAISSSVEDLQNIADDFGDCLTRLFHKIEDEKNKPVMLDAVTPTKSRDICPHCSRDKGEVNYPDIDEAVKVCRVCSVKLERGRQLGGEPGEPHTLEEVGDNIAVVMLDGNMIGQMFAQTRTPAEYTFKSDTFSKGFSRLLDKSIEDVRRKCSHLFMRMLGNGEEFFGFQKVYAGGDDILLIMNARGAVHFTRHFVEEVAKEFLFERVNGFVEKPTVTFSAGIAMANYKFPVYFLIEKAHNLLKEAKGKLRKEIVMDDHRLLNVPIGVLSLSVVTSSMPSEKSFTFILPRDDEKLSKIQRFVERAVANDQWHSLISLLINIEDDVGARLNFVKYLYGRALSKETIMNAAASEQSGEDRLYVVKELVNALKFKEVLGSIVPMLRIDQPGED
ncbi:MAG: hypothetical protein ACE5QW_07115 [Thermoplasmata archaeon]